MTDQRRLVRELVGAHGRTFAEEAGITLRDTPQPLYRLLVLALLLSARIRGSIALATARELSRAGLRDPRRTAEADWQERVDALGPGRIPALRRAHGHPTRRRSTAVARPVGR